MTPYAIGIPIAKAIGSRLENTGGPQGLLAPTGDRRFEIHVQLLIEGAWTLRGRLPPAQPLPKTANREP